MVKHTQTVSVFGHFSGLTLKGLSYVKNRYTFAEFIIELVALAVIVGGDRNILCQYFLLMALVWSSTISKIRTGNSIYEGSILS